MSAPSRFQVDAWSAPRRGVTVGEGRDTATGLQVRVLRFEGPARGDPASLDHPNLPGVVAAETVDGVTHLVTLVPHHDRSLDGDQAGMNAEAVVAAGDALAALHAAGIVHGDIGLHQLSLGPGGHLLLLGAGAPWRGPDHEPTVGDDVRALAVALLEAGRDLPVPLERVLQRAASTTASGTDGRRFADALTQAAHGSDEHDDGRVAVVKDLPPGGVYKSGETGAPRKPGRYEAGGPRAPRRQPRRPPTLLLAAVAIVALVGVASWLLRDRDAPAPAADLPAAYVVDVNVAPLGAPPFSIVVVDAPSGTSLIPGTRLGRAPRRVVLDVPGRWVLQGVFGQRRSAPVVVRVPAATSATLTLPPETADPPATSPR